VWTEGAIGSEARSLRRWVYRAVLPRLWSYTVLLVFVLIVVTAFADLVPPAGRMCALSVPDCPKPDPGICLSDLLLW